MPELDPFEAARELLQREPLPPDAEKQMDRIRKRVPKAERGIFDSMYEALAVRQNEAVT